MKTKSIYITVKLDIEYDESLDFEEVKEKILSEMDYNFSYKRYLADDENNQLMEKIVNTEIYGQYED